MHFVAITDFAFEQRNRPLAATAISWLPRSTSSPRAKWGGFTAAPCAAMTLNLLLPAAQLTALRDDCRRAAREHSSGLDGFTLIAP
jgi:hypothetical protein